MDAFKRREKRKKKQKIVEGEKTDRFLQHQRSKKQQRERTLQKKKKPF
jgi:hypothetical protein